MLAGCAGAEEGRRTQMGSQFCHPCVCVGGGEGGEGDGKEIVSLGCLNVYH